MTAPQASQIGSTYAACAFDATGAIVSRLNVATVALTAPGSGEYTVTLQEGIDDADCVFGACVQGPAGAAGTCATVEKTGNATFKVQVSVGGAAAADEACGFWVTRTNIG